MIRLLIIGRDSERWRDQLGARTETAIEVVAETLPAAGIRNFSEISPDAVVLVGAGQGSKIEPIIEAIRERPLGQIAPVLVVGDGTPLVEDLAVAAVVSEEDGASGLVGELERLLEVDLGVEPHHAGSTSVSELEVDRDESGDEETDRTLVSTEIPTVQEGTDTGDERGDETIRPDDSAGAQIERRDYVIESLDGDNEGASGPQPHRRSQGGVAEGGRESDLDTAAIRRKLKEVRHEDYFVILDIPRSAEAEDVQQAYRGLKARFQVDHVDIHLAEKFEAELDEINDALDDARAVLGDETLREAYLDRTTRR